MTGPPWASKAPRRSSSTANGSNHNRSKISTRQSTNSWLTRHADGHPHRWGSTTLGTTPADMWRSRRRGGLCVGPREDCHLAGRSEEHTSELQSLMRISDDVFCLKKNKCQH